MSKLYLSRNPKVAARALDGEMMIMSAKDSTLFTLNRTATILWQAADGATALDEIVQRRICTVFDIAASEALTDAENLARELANHEILQISDAPIQSGLPVMTEKR
ncbi:MAG TPA: PqqD family protein [Candidatus Eisenbacteria bacterium]|nr:PqqD family protein [Candidatus Eisenbacteria bacterium]